MMANPPPTTADEPTADVQRRGLPAWMMSVTVHAALVLALSFLIRVAPRGAAVEPNRDAGIVLVVSTSAGTPEYLTESDMQSDSAAAQASAASVAPLPAEVDIALDLPGGLPALEGQGIGDAVGELPSVDGFTQGKRPSRNLTGYEVETGVFGVTGVGNKFVYVFDRSSSMEGYRGRPLAAAKSQLIESLKGLKKTNQFQIVFYNERTAVFNPNPAQSAQMMFGNDQSKELAGRFVSGITGSGSTRHMPALKMALRMSPDVIFFLTDADYPQLTPEELREVRILNGRVGATINAIEFGAGSARGGLNFLQQLARENNGQHTYVDVTRLPE